MDDTRDRFFRDLGPRLGRTAETPRRIYFETSAEDLPEVADYLFNVLGCRLSTATGLETYSAIEVLYHFSHDRTGRYFCPRVLIPDLKSPRIPSITGIVKGAEWIEREMAELLGIVFEGHPRPEPLLTRDHPEPPPTPLRLRRIA